MHREALKKVRRLQFGLQRVSLIRVTKQVCSGKTKKLLSGD
jgi:hypothetical protein